MRISRVNSTFIKDTIRFIKIRVLGLNDAQTSYQSLPHGIDSNPVKDMVAIQAPTGINGETVVIGYIQKEVLADTGETHLFSTDENGQEVLRIKLKNDGTAEFGGDTDNLVRYSKLEKAFNDLKSDFNDLVSKYNSHIHITTATVGATPTPGVIAPTTTTDSPSQADITPAKIEEFKSL